MNIIKSLGAGFLIFLFIFFFVDGSHALKMTYSVVSGIILIFLSTVGFKKRDEEKKKWLRNEEKIKGFQGMAEALFLTSLPLLFIPVIILYFQIN